MHKPLISIISPVYKADTIVTELVKRIKKEISKITDDYEIILVDDGSPDQSWRKIEENCETDKKVKGIKLSRNFGQHYAISAGLSEAHGENVIIIDCDLQDNPKYIHDLLKKSHEGFDVVCTIKKYRQHKKLKNLIAALFHKLFNYLVGNKLFHSNGQIGTYSLITRKVVDAYCRVSDYQRHYMMILRWLGFSTTYIIIEHEKRFEGKTSYTISKLITHALNGITSQTDKLLRLSIYTGFFFASTGLISIIFIIINSIRHGFQSGWASIIVIIIFTSGLLLISLGIVGIYIGKIFEQVKDRPLYIIDMRINI